MKRASVILTTLLMTVCLSGCGLVPSLNLTESEQKVIAEYAAGLLLKYDRNYSGALMEIEEEEDEVSIIPEVQEPVYETEEEPEVQGEFNDPDFSEDLEASENGGQSDEMAYSEVPISDVIGVDGFTIMYKNYEVHEIYPEAESDDLVFSLQAMQGNELVVMNFAITNDGAEKKLCDILDSDVSFKVVINGEKTISASKTILLNDLSSYYDEIEGYGMADAVIVCEIPADDAHNIQTLDLIVRRDNQSYNYRLR